MKNKINGDAIPEPFETGAPVMAGLQLPNIGKEMFPFTAVPFSRPLAWVRLLAYGTLAIGTFKKYRTISYVAMSAAGISAMTSLANGDK